MIKDITLGQFFPGKSPVHKIDPRIKLIMTIILIVAIFNAMNPFSFLVVILCTLALVFISRISLKVIIKGLKPIVFLLVFTSVIHIIMTKTGVLLVDFYFIHIYSDGIINAVIMMLRIISLIASTSVLLTYTTSPIVLTDGIEGLLSPLTKIGIRGVHEFAMMMSIALRFIPTLIDETDKIMNAQKARGTDFSTGSLISRAKALIPIFIPLLFSAIRRAEELACAMECRCYRGGGNRTKMNPLKCRYTDFIWLFVCAVFLLAVIFVDRMTSDINVTDMILNIVK